MAVPWTGFPMARLVEIAKPLSSAKYVRMETFLDPAIAVPALTVGWKLAKKSLGFRTLMDVIPLDATLVRGSHGRPGAGPDGPLIMSRKPGAIPSPTIASTDVYAIVLTHLGARDAR